MRPDHERTMFDNRKSITQVIAPLEHRQHVNLVGRRDLEFVLQDWGFVEKLSLTPRSSDQLSEQITAMRNQLVGEEVVAGDEVVKLSALIEAAKVSGMKDLSITITKAALLKLHGSASKLAMPDGSQLRFSAEQSGDVTMYVRFH